MTDMMQSNQKKINVSDYKSPMQFKTSHKDFASACNEHPVKSLLFLFLFICCNIYYVLIYFVPISMEPRKNERHADGYLPVLTTLPLTVGYDLFYFIFQGLGESNGFRDKNSACSPCCEGVVARDIIFPFFLQKTEEDVSRKPDRECLPLEWHGRPSERKQGLSEERLPK